MISILARIARYTLRRRDEGATAVEYGLLVALIAVVLVGAAIFLGEQISGALEEAGSSIDGGGFGGDDGGDGGDGGGDE